MGQVTIVCTNAKVMAPLSLLTNPVQQLLQEIVIISIYFGIGVFLAVNQN